MLVTPSKASSNGIAPSNTAEHPDSTVQTNWLVASALQLSNDLRPVIPGMAQIIKDAVAEVVERETELQEARTEETAERERETRRLAARAERTQERLEEDRADLSRLEQARASVCRRVADAAAPLDVFVPLDARSVGEMAAALQRNPTPRPRSVPVPGEPSGVQRALLLLLRLTAPFLLAILFSVGLASMTGMIPPNALQNPDMAPPVTLAILLVFWLIGAGLHHLLIATGEKVGKNHATARYEGYVSDLPAGVSQKAPAWVGTGLLVFLWLVASLFEGYGLRRMADELAFMGSDPAPPLWAFCLLGSLASGAVVVFAIYVPYSDGSRELSRGFARQFDGQPAPPLTEAEQEARRALMASACELVDLNVRVDRLEAGIKANELLLAEKPQVSPEIKQRVARAEAAVEKARHLLYERMDYICRRMGILPPLIRMGEADVPTRMLWMPFVKAWMHLPPENGEGWPER